MTSVQFLILVWNSAHAVMHNTPNRAEKDGVVSMARKMVCEQFAFWEDYDEFVNALEMGRDEFIEWVMDRAGTAPE